MYKLEWRRPHQNVMAKGIITHACQDTGRHHGDARGNIEPPPPLLSAATAHVTLALVYFWQQSLPTPPPSTLLPYQLSILDVC